VDKVDDELKSYEGKLKTIVAASPTPHISLHNLTLTTVRRRNINKTDEHGTQQGMYELKARQNT
jgi:hypothetical protein